MAEANSVKTAGIFSGGGSWGAYMAGVHLAAKRKYDAYIGTSTGSLMALMLALGQLDKRYYDILEKEYSDTDNYQMYGSLHPFNSKGELSGIKLATRIVYQVARKKNYIYDISEGLEKKLRSHFRINEFNALRAAKIDVIVTAQNVSLKNSDSRYVSILDQFMSYEVFVKCVVASACIPGFAKPVVIDGYNFCDGGILDPVPSALVKQFDQVETWLMHPKNGEYVELVDTNTLAGLFLSSIIPTMRNKIKLECLEDLKGSKVYYSQTPKYKAANFDKAEMKKMVAMGREDWINRRVYQEDIK